MTWSVNWTEESWTEQATGRLRALRKILPLLVERPSGDDRSFDRLICELAEVIDQWVAKNISGEEAVERMLRWMATKDANRSRQLRARRALGGPWMLTVTCRDEAEAHGVIDRCRVVLADGGRFLPGTWGIFRNREMGLDCLSEDAYVVVVMVQNPPPVMRHELDEAIGFSGLVSQKIDSDDLPGKYYGQLLDRFDYVTKQD